MERKSSSIRNGDFIKRVCGTVEKNKLIVKCSVCQKQFSTFIFPFGIKNAERRISKKFNLCNSCQSYVCDDCFIITNGTSMIEGRCISCATKQNIFGTTTTDSLK